MEVSLDIHPQYWERLSDSDKAMYEVLRQSFASPSCKNQRCRSKDNFSDILKGLKTFIVRGDSGDKNRMLACGICWLSDNKIAINVRQLRIILSKCKSSINGSFQGLGYGTVPSGSDSSRAFIRLFPEFENNFIGLRQWTVRQPLSETLTPRILQEVLMRSFSGPEYVTPPPSLLPQIPQLNQNAMTIESRVPLLPQVTMSAPPCPFSALQPTLPQSTQPQQQEEVHEEVVGSPEQTPSFENDEFSNFMWPSDDFI